MDTGDRKTWKPGQLSGRLSTTKKGPCKKRKTDAFLKRRIWEIRKNYHHCCGQKIQYNLEIDYGVSVSATTIYKVLKEKYQLRS
jgi:hypothetical protein